MEDLEKSIQYKQELFAQKTPYLQWLCAQEAELRAQYGQQPGRDGLGKQIYTLPFSSCMDSVKGYGEFGAGAVYLFVKRGGTLSAYAGNVISDVFGEDDTVLVYADEDSKGSLRELYGIEDRDFGDKVTMPYRFGSNGKGSCSYAYYRGAPWFKPDFSPDTLASFFYIGSVFAVRGDIVSEMTGKYGSDISIYELVYRIFMDVLDRKMHGGCENIVHIPKVLYTNDSLADGERMNDSDEIKAFYKTEKLVCDIASEKISIVIPSKDNAQVLQKCLKSLIYYTNYNSYEIIIVDNGSNKEQKRYITDVIDELKKENENHAINYLYQESVFNFSAMCNAGAHLADGQYLLFLNDDIEIMNTDVGRRWLDLMMEYARKSHVGAVGAKLYYPSDQGENGCYKIQHAGITNMGIGPAHKLGGMLDEGCIYHGHNTLNYDMIAVTAACMLVRKSVFDEAGGFDETFPVAYNDVELCFRLYQRGYFNVQVNEAVLVHHESLSRGQDTSPEKQARLHGEKEKLYQKHPLLNARDPFYSPNLVQWKKDIEYNTGYLYDYDRQAGLVKLENDEEGIKRKRAVFKMYDFRNLLHAKCGLLAKIYDRLTGYHDLMLQIDSISGAEDINRHTDMDLTGHMVTIEGWYAVKNADNADIPRKLWLIYETRGLDYRNVYEFDIAPKLREDVAGLLEGIGSRKGTRNTALSGIHVNIGKDAVKPGVYRIGVLGRNMLVCSPGNYIKIE